jgi:predicted transcriptional regulator
VIFCAIEVSMDKGPDGKFAGGNKIGRRFRPGQSGNPKGRPKSITLSEAYRRELAKVDPDDPEGRTRAEVLAEQMYAKAKTGDVQALREMADRTEGKPRQTLSLSLERREQLEAAVEGIMRDAEAAGEPCTREEAIATLAAFTPEVSELIN